jgi:hypothetical protein
VFFLMIILNLRGLKRMGLWLLELLVLVSVWKLKFIRLYELIIYYNCELFIIIILYLYLLINLLLSL